MKVTLHLEPESRAIGGAETLAVNLATMLKARHRVEIVHHRPWLTLDALASFAGVDLGGVKLRYVERRLRYLWADSKGLLDSYREPRTWGRELAGDADTFLTVTHSLPPFNPAQHGVMILLFPFTSPLDEWRLQLPAGGVTPSWRARMRCAYYRGQYAALWRGYQVKLAISEFTNHWSQRRWGVNCDVLPPVVDCSALNESKEDLVLTLGRFSVVGVQKHQREMAQAFLTASGLGPYRLACLGEARTPQEVAYAGHVASQDGRVEVVVNAARAEVRSRLARARFFWHAAGMTVDDETKPELLEHFGIVTVEAMANGCVPIVIGRGGQPEIVDHGVTGFLCRSLDEIAARTAELAADSARWQRMSAAARMAAQRFDRSAFEARFRRLTPFMNGE